METIIRTENLTKEFKKRVISKSRLMNFIFPRFTYFRAVDNVSLDIFKGETLGIIGPNGAGKTTLFNLICGLISPSKGTVLINNEEINESKNTCPLYYAFFRGEKVCWGRCVLVH